IADANANNQANVIDFGPAFNTLQTITLDGSVLSLTDTGGKQEIQGPAAGLIISGGGKSNVFQVGGGVTATFSGLTISDGYAAVVNNGTATLTDCVITGNVTAAAPVQESATPTLPPCTISRNPATYAGAGVKNNGMITLDACTISGNTASGGQTGNFGGGVFNRGTAILTNCTISGNAAFGGGMFNINKAVLTGCKISG